MQRNRMRHEDQTSVENVSHMIENGTQMDPKWDQNATKTGPKGNQNGGEMGLEAPKRGLGVKVIFLIDF